MSIRAFLSLSIGFLLVKEQRAFLTFPRSVPARTQLSVGVGIPIDSGEAISIVSGWVLKSLHELPVNSTALHPIYFPGIFTDNGIKPQFSFGRKRREIVTDNVTGQDYERYDGEVKVLESVPNASGDDEFDDGGADYSYDEEEDLLQEFEDSNNASISYEKKKKVERMPDSYDPSDLRWIVYKSLETVVKNKGFEGKPCVLRAICEAAHAPFTHDSGLFGELLYIVMTPSSSGDQLSTHSDNEYLRAEKMGASGAPCDHIFSDCPESILELFSGVYDPMVEFLHMMG